MSESVEGAKGTPTVAVVGCGLAGCMMAILLARRGYRVEIFEKSEDWRKVKENKGDDLHRNTIKRSINLALSHRGRCALRKLGLEDQVLKRAIPMRCRAIHTQKTGSPDADDFQPYDENDSKNCIYSVSRELLNTLLLEKLEEHPRVKIFFGHHLMHIDRQGVVHFENKGSGVSLNTYNDFQKGDYQLKPRLTIGADGAYSVVRESLLRLQRTNFERNYISHGYKELTIPPDANGSFALKDHNALHIWPRGSFMMIALPNPDKSFTCTIFAPLHSEGGLTGLMDVKTEGQIRDYMNTHFPDAVKVMPRYIQDFKENPTSPLVQVKVSPWNFKDQILLVGDSAHAMVPFYGQGMNAAFEDCLQFEETLEKFNDDISKAVLEFAKEREPAGRSIAQLSMGNYLEMRHHTGSKLFLLRKKLEGMLNYAFPNHWIPLYKMVTFTRIPYDKVIELEEKQADILEKSSYAAALCFSAGLLWAAKTVIKSSL